MITSSPERAIVSATVRAQLGGLRRRFRDLLINLVMVTVTFFIITTAVRTLAGVGASSASALPSITVAFLTWTAALTVYGDLMLALNRSTATPLTVARGGWARARSLAVWFLGSTLIASAAWLALLLAMRATWSNSSTSTCPASCRSSSSPLPARSGSRCSRAGTS